MAAIIMLASCNTKRTRNYQYFPDMYEAVSYETYGVNPVLKDSMASQAPVIGTIARGQELPYEYPNTEAGYIMAKDSLKSPLKLDKENLDKGKFLYDIYCASCHGKKGAGDGELVKREKFLGVPNYKDRDITQGSIYQVIMYGRNLMGSHASQLTEKERWQVTMYVQKLKSELK